MNTRVWMIAVWASVSGACVLPVPKDGGELMDTGTGTGTQGGGGTDSSGIGMTAQDGTSGSMTETGASSTGDGGTTDGGTTDGSETTGGDVPLSVCDPQPEAVEHILIVDGIRDLPTEVVQLDVSCDVTGIDAVGGEVAIELDCDDGPHDLDVPDLGPIDLAVGQSVSFRVYDSQPWFRHTYVMLMREQTVIVAGMNGLGLPSGDGDEYLPPGTFFEPLAVEVVPDVCRPEPVAEREDPEECGFICAPACTQDERQALRFTNAEGSTDIYDHGTGSLGGLQIAVAEAEVHVQIFCVDTARSRYRFVAVRTM